MIKYLLGLAFVVSTLNSDLFAQEQKIKRYEKGYFQVQESYYMTTNSSGIVEKLKLKYKCVADCFLVSVVYESSNSHYQIPLKIVNDGSMTHYIRVKFPNSNELYDLQISYGLQIACHNPDGTIQIFKSYWPD